LERIGTIKNLVLHSLTLHYMHPIDRRGNVESVFVDGEAIDIAAVRRGARITLASGATTDADKVLLATGNEVPAELPGNETLADSAHYAANPWQIGHFSWLFSSTRSPARSPPRPAASKAGCSKRAGPVSREGSRNGFAAP
jgi:hypothetical protein